MNTSIQGPRREEKAGKRAPPPGSAGWPVAFRAYNVIIKFTPDGRGFFYAKPHPPPFSADSPGSIAFSSSAVYNKNVRTVLPGRRPPHKTCIGYRLSEKYWGQGIASQTLARMLEYLFSQTDIEIVTASTMIENRASAQVLEKNGFLLTASAVPEDWGYDRPTMADKWFR